MVFNYVHLAWSHVHVRFNHSTKLTNPIYIAIDYCQVRTFWVLFCRSKSSHWTILNIISSFLEISLVNRREISTELFGFFRRRINYVFLMSNSSENVNVLCNTFNNRDAKTLFFIFLPFICHKKCKHVMLRVSTQNNEQNSIRQTILSLEFQSLI